MVCRHSMEPSCPVNCFQFPPIPPWDVRLNQKEQRYEKTVGQDKVGMGKNNNKYKWCKSNNLSYPTSRLMPSQSSSNGYFGKTHVPFPVQYTIWANAAISLAAGWVYFFNLIWFDFFGSYQPSFLAVRNCYPTYQQT